MDNKKNEKRKVEKNLSGNQSNFLNPKSQYQNPMKNVRTADTYTEERYFSYREAENSNAKDRSSKNDED